jgi:hypothetical protein
MVYYFGNNKWVCTKEPSFPRYIHGSVAPYSGAANHLPCGRPASSGIAHTPIPIIILIQLALFFLFSYLISISHAIAADIALFCFEGGQGCSSIAPRRAATSEYLPVPMNPLAPRHVTFFHSELTHNSFQIRFRISCCCFYWNAMPRPRPHRAKSNRTIDNY